MIGSLPPPLGGTTVLFQQLVDMLRETKHIDPMVVNVTGTKITSPRKIIHALYNIFRGAKNADIISIHVHLSSMHILVPPCLVAARLFRKPLIIRQFGGIGYNTLGTLRGSFNRWLYRCSDLCLFELKEMVEKNQGDGLDNVKWYSNSRSMPSLSEVPLKRPSCRRFIFLGHVKPSKGIFEIIKAVEFIDCDCIVDFYGPFYDGVSEETFSGLKGVRYCGVLEPKDVKNTLALYDALLLPTYHSGEGYPGVVLEAYAVGLPVICTHWHGLSEIVDENCGILVEPRNVDALRAAMSKLMNDDHLYIRLQEGVIKRRQEFSSNLWRDRFLEYCLELIQSKNRK
jgi:glycosyltransferase involved in cell wall biosynthesis